MKITKNIVLTILLFSFVQQSNAGRWTDRVVGTSFAFAGSVFTALGAYAIQQGVKDFYITDSYEKLPVLHVKFNERIVGPGAVLCIPSILLVGAGIYIIYNSFNKKNRVRHQSAIGL